MARIRTIKPEFWQDEKLSLLDPLTRLVFLGLISQADDAGRLVDNVKLLDGLLFPETDDTCREALDTLARVSRILRYSTASGQRVIQITHWDKHQKVDKPSKQVLPGPDESSEAKPADTADSRESRESVASDSRESRAPTMDHGPRTLEHGPTTSSAHAHEGSPPSGLKEEDEVIGLDLKDNQRLVKAINGQVPSLREFIFRVNQALFASQGDAIAKSWEGFGSAKRTDWLLVAWDKMLAAKNVQSRARYVAGVIGSALVDGIDLASPGDQGSCAPPPGPAAPEPIDPERVRGVTRRQLLPLLGQAGWERDKALRYCAEAPVEELKAMLRELAKGVNDGAA